MIDVLLATYKPNLEWLKQQVDSILGQRGVEVNLIRREDADGLGACGNFGALLKESKSEYVAFADQDDVWLPNKLEKSLKLLQQLEAKYGKESPCVVFTDTRVVDMELRTLNESFFEQINIDPNRTLPRQLVFQNVASGNTILMNAALRERALPIPSEAYMHDHWVILTAALYGHVACLREPTLLYRQHGHNVEGGGKVGWRYYLKRARQGIASIRRRQNANIRQAAMFPEFEYLRDFERKSWLARCCIIVQHRLWKCGWLRNIGTLFVI